MIHFSPPQYHTSLAPIHLAHWSKSAFILSLLCSRAYSGFPLFYHIASKILGLAFEAFNQLVLLTPISPISFLIILLSSQATMLIDLHIWFAYFYACSLPVNTSHFSLLIHAYHFKIQLKTLSCGKPVLVNPFLFFCSMFHIILIYKIYFTLTFFHCCFAFEKIAGLIC